MIDGWSITAIEHSQPGVRAIDSDVPYIHYLVDDERSGIILLIDSDIVTRRDCGKDKALYKIGLKKQEAKLLCRELIGTLDQHLGVIV